MYVPNSRAVPSQHYDRLHLNCNVMLKKFFFSAKRQIEQNDAGGEKKKSVQVLLKNSVFSFFPPRWSKNPSRPLSHTVYDQDEQKQLRSPLRYRSFLPAPIINVQRREFVCNNQRPTKVLTDISGVSNSTENTDLHKIPPSSFFPFCSFHTIF